MGWRPIETAPQDGTPIDIWCAGFRYTDAYWDQTQGAWLDEDGDTIKDFYGEEPTHWMPLPEPPK